MQVSCFSRFRLVQIMGMEVFWLYVLWFMQYGLLQVMCLGCMSFLLQVLMPFRLEA